MVTLEAEMTVPLAPDYFRFRRGFDIELLTHGPLLLRSRAAGRWHRPRSGHRHVYQGGRVSWSYWCGQQTGSEPVLTASRLPEGEPACGTCEGRALGAGFPSSVLPDAPVLFAPRINAPTKCPGDKFTPLDDRWRYGTCLWCGSVEHVTGGERGYSWSPVRLRTHEPLELIAPCPNHGWLSMVELDGQLVCECRTEEVAA